jgi:ATP synthase protein I
MDKKTDHRKDDFRPLHSIAVASGAGMTMVVSIGVGIWLGKKIDEFLGTFPIGTIIMALIGALSGILSVIKGILNEK